jgi:hypothetical protein
VLVPTGRAADDVELVNAGFVLVADVLTVAKVDNCDVLNEVVEDFAVVAVLDVPAIVVVGGRDPIALP